MRIRLLIIAQKIPAWIHSAYQNYKKRLPSSLSLELIFIKDEKKILSQIKSNHRVIALDVKGELWNTEMLSQKLHEWKQQEKGIDFLIGGPDGLPGHCLKTANFKWSLSPLTFPHFFVPLLIAEQIYRAAMILENHPYHRQ